MHATTWQGTEYFISFLTPDGDAYVLVPVKFIVINDAIAGIMSAQVISSAVAALLMMNGHRRPKVMAPAIAPFMEKALPGRNGSASGPRMLPASHAQIRATVPRLPMSTAPVSSQREMVMERAISAMIEGIMYFPARTSSTGIRTVLSKGVNFTRLISGVALRPSSMNCGKSLARIGPNVTLNPDWSATVLAHTPDALS